MKHSGFPLLVVVFLLSFALPNQASAALNQEFSEGTKIVNGVCFEWMRIITHGDCDDYERYWTRPCGSGVDWVLEWDGKLRNASVTGTPIQYDLNGNGLVPVNPGFGGYVSYVSYPVGAVSFNHDQSSTVVIEADILEYQETCE